MKQQRMSPRRVYVSSRNPHELRPATMLHFLAKPNLQERGMGLSSRRLASFFNFWSVSLTAILNLGELSIKAKDAD